MYAATEQDFTKIHGHQPKDLPLPTTQSPRLELGHRGARFEVFRFLHSLAVRSWWGHGPVWPAICEERGHSRAEGSKHTALVLGPFYAWGIHTKWEVGEPLVKGPLGVPELSAKDKRRVSQVPGDALSLVPPQDSQLT